jgi:MYND finger
MTTEHRCANDGCNKDSTSRCAACNAVWYCSKDCQKRDWRHHKPSCNPTTPAPIASQNSDPTEPVRDIPCVKILSHGEGRRYEAITLPSTDPIFTSEPLPVTVRFGYPLVMKRTHFNLGRKPDTDNQHATWLNIDPNTGWAADKWQHSIGSVIVANPDRTPLKVATLAAITDYISEILDEFGEGGPESVKKKYYGQRRRELLDKYIVRHEKMQADYQTSLNEYLANPDKFRTVQ